MDEVQGGGPQRSARGVWVGVLAVIVIALAAYGVYDMRGNGGAPAADNNVPAEQGGAVSGAPEASSTPITAAVTVNISAKSFSFTPSEIRVKKGDVVKIVLKNTDGYHDFVVDEFNARTPRINAGQTAETTFLADKTGTFEFYCSVGTHRQMGMRGKLIVE